MIDVFGLPSEDVETNPLFADEAPAVEAPEATEAPTQPEATTQETPSEVATQEAPDLALGEVSQPTETTESGGREETATEAAEKVFAGKYKTVEDLEQGYREVRDLQRRTAERARAYEDQQREIGSRAQQLEDALRKAVPYIQQLQSENQTLRQRPQLDEFGNPVQAPNQVVNPQPGIDPRALEGYVSQLTQSQVAQLRQEMAAEQARNQELDERRYAIMDFYERHPEVEMRGPLDSDIKEVVQTLSDSWDDWEPDISNPDTLDIAYEAAKDPALLAVLKRNPSYIDDEDGMKLARFEAAILRGEPITQQTSTVPASVVGTRKPVVERASTVSPNAGPGSAPYDPWKEAVEEYRKESRDGLGGSIF